MRRLAALALAAAAAVTVVAGCGGGAKVATVPVPQLVVRMQTSGAFAYDGSYATNAGAGRSCADAARHGNGTAGFVVGPAGSRTLPLYFSVRVPGYRGPATYRGADVRLDEVLVADHGRQTRFHRAAVPAPEMTVSSDGSGTATLPRLVAPDGTTLSASLQWTCVTERWRAHAS